jgi:NAD(P)-dependent dehydrogenase (short-subunit alcohol dehydrogenase family)
MERPGRLEGKVCVITGAASGIGAEAARLFMAEGARVVGVDISEGSEGHLPIVADVTEPDQVERVYAQTREEFGRIDVLFNNAGINPAEDTSILNTPIDVFQRVQDVNLRSVFLCCKYGIPHLLENETGGSVINTASFVAVMGAAVSQISYTASKGAVMALSREIGVEFAHRGVRVNSLCPGPVDTPLLHDLFASDPAKAARRLVHLPFGRFAKASEVANGALFLASDESSYVTASSFMVDGGLSQAYLTPDASDDPQY